MDITDRKIEEAVNKLSQKLDSYTRLVDYRYKNMLVKAAAEQMLPVEVEDPESGMVHLEDVAKLGITADDQFTVFAKDPVMLPKIQAAIFKTHPLIKQELTIPDVSGDEKVKMITEVATQIMGHKPEPVQSLILTMPPMTKERRDVVRKAVDMLVDQCKAVFLECLTENKLMLTARVVVLEPNRVDEGCDKLQAKHDEMWKAVEDKTSEFLKDVEERYQAYEASQPHKETVSEMSQEERIHSGLSFSLSGYEE